MSSALKVGTMSAVPTSRLHTRVLSADLNWVECTDELPSRKHSRFSQIILHAVPDAAPLPTLSKHQAAEPAHEPSRTHPDLPEQPPWKVYIGNVPYELTERDVEDVFTGLEV